MIKHLHSIFVFACMIIFLGMGVACNKSEKPQPIEEKQVDDPPKVDDEDAQPEPEEEPAQPQERLCDECTTFDYMGTQREYLLYLPDGLPEGAPLVFILHGSNGIASKYPGWFLMDDIAEEEKFAVVYPQGLLAPGGYTHWNAGLTFSEVDDVGFLAALAEYLQQEYNLNPEKTFPSGYSNGGFMSYHLIAERPNIFKAAASINGTMSGETWSKRSDIPPAPILQLSGALDETVPIDGSIGEPGGWGGAPDMETIIDFWADLNACSTTDTVQADPHTIAYKHRNGVNGNEVWYYLVDNRGHDFPRGEDGRINTSTVIWDFFSRY